MRPSLRVLGSWFLDLLLPEGCLGCSCIVSSVEGFCVTCREQLEPNRDRAVASLPLFAPHRYGGPMATAIRRLKYEDRSEFAARLVRAVHCPVRPSALEGATLVPVPMHPSRLVVRGYNQAGLLAGALAKRWQLPVSYCLLRRQQSVARQVGLGRLEREANVRGAFVANAKGYRGGAVVLVDDVVTTGATIFACQTALSDMGISVSAIVALARAEEGQAQAVAASPVLPVFGLGELHSS